MITMGIDSGSAMTKAALFDGEKIIAYRSDHYFYSLEELMEVPGMTPRLYEKLMEQVTLDYQDY